MPSAFKISVFNGMNPQMAPRVLPDSSAQVANNVKLTSSEMRPLRGPYTINTPAKPLPAISIYKAFYGANQAWLSWPFDVDVVRGPMPSEVEPRFYWTGDGEPRFGRYSDVTSGGLNNYPSSYFALGIPTPTLQPAVAPTGGVSSTNATRYYCYTYFSQLGEESAPSPVSAVQTGKVDATWAVTNMDVFPANSGVGTASYSAGTGLTTFTNTSLAHWLRAGDVASIGGTDVAVTAATSSTVFTVPGDFHTATTWARKAPWNTTGMKRRLYRTSGSLGSFQLVNDNVGTTYNDTLTDGQIMGDALISAGWVPPPTDLKAIIVHPSGALVGIAGNQVCFSEPYQPHAWPLRYRQATDYDGVGLGVYGSTIVVGTQGNPYTITGVDPSAMSSEKIPGAYPCLSKRSLMSVGDGVIYATKHGMLLIGVNGVDIMSKDFFTRDEWANYAPENMISEFAYSRVYVATIDITGRRRILIMDTSDFTTVDIEVYEIFTDLGTGTLYVSTTAGIGEWDSALSIPLQASWKSKIFMLGTPTNLGAAKLEFDQAIDPDARAAIVSAISTIKAANDGVQASGYAAAGYGAFGYSRRCVGMSKMANFPDMPASNEVTFILFYDGKPFFSKVVTSNAAFRLPAGKKTDTVEVQVNGQCPINEIRFAETMDLLRRV